MVNFVSIFCPDLQKLLKPIYDLMKKGRQFVWGKEQQDAFEEIKHRLQKPQVDDSKTDIEENSPFQENIYPKFMKDLISHISGAS